MSGFSDEGLLNHKDSIHIHVENLKSPRGYFLFSTWARIISSEVFFSSPRGGHFVSTWRILNLHVKIANSPRGDRIF